MKSTFTCALLIGLLLTTIQAQDKPPKPEEAAAAERAQGVAETTITNAPSPAPKSDAAPDTNLLVAA